METIPYGDGPDRYGELRQPDGSAERPLVVLIHGGFWREQYRLDLMHDLAEDLRMRGHASWNIEYRRVGPSGGGYPETLDDVATAIDHVADGPWPGHVAIGHSAGGHLALWNASRRDPPAAPRLTVGLAAVSDVVACNRRGIGVDATANFFGGDVDERPRAYAAGQPDPTAFAGRVVLIHGDADDIVPVDLSTTLEPHVDRVEVMAGGDHFDVIDPSSAAWRIVCEELAEL